MIDRAPEAMSGEEEDPGALDGQAAAALVPLVRAVRSHLGLVLAATLVSLVVCSLLLMQRSTVYEARSQILVTPLIEGETSYIGLPILRTSPGDPTRTVETAAALISSPDVAERVAAEVGDLDEADVRAAVTVEPAEETNVVNVTAEAGDPDLAAEIASAYAVGVIEIQREVLEPLVRRELRQTQRQVDARTRGSGSVGIDLRTRLSQLRTIRDGTDPTLSVAQLAEVPTSPTGRPGWLLLAIAGAGGLLVGVGTAVLVGLASPRRIEDGADLFAILAVPILSRLPTHKRTLGVRSRDVAAEERGGYRLLRARLGFPESQSASASAGGEATRGKLILMLGIGRESGATTAAVGLATTITETGDSAVLVDARGLGDGLGEKLGMPAHPATADDQQISGGPTSVPDRPGLGLITLDADGNQGRPLVEIADQARELAANVIIDAGSPDDLNAILAILPAADDVVLVVRYGKSTALDLVLAADALAQTWSTSRAGYLLVGPSRAGDALYRGREGGWVVHADPPQGSFSSVPARVDG